MFSSREELDERRVPVSAPGDHLAARRSGRRTRRPTPVPCRSTRPSDTRSTTPSTPRTSSRLPCPGNIYTRIMNPTWDVLEQRVTALEGAVAACVTASGQAAVTYAVLNITRTGDNIVALSTLYGGTYNLFAHTLPQYGIEVRFVDPDAPGDLAQHVDENTKLVFAETIGNPRVNVVDIDAWSEAAHGLGLPLDRGQHDRHADPHAGPRPRRRHRHPLADQVHRRPRHLDRRHRRRQRDLRLDGPRRPLPGPHEARPVVPRRGLERRPRAGGLHRPGAHGAAAQHRRGAVAVQRVPLPAGHRDAAAADGAPLRERARRGEAPGGAPAGDLGLLPGPARRRRTTRWPTGS